MLVASLLSTEKMKVLYRHGLKLRQMDFKYPRMLWSQGGGEDYKITKVKHAGEVCSTMHPQETFVCELMNK